MSATLPPELLEHVFSCLAEEKVCLRSCSLVCRAWRDVAQTALFQDTRLHLRRVPWMVPDQMHDLGGIVPLFHRLQILEIIFTNALETSSEEAPNGVDNHLLVFKAGPTPRNGDWVPRGLVIRWDLAISLLYTITTLELYSVVFDDFAALRDVLCGLPALERLSIRAPEVRQQDILPAYTGLRLRSFKSILRHGGSDQVVVRMILTWLATAEEPRLEEMSLELSEPVCSALQDVLVSCARSMRMLEVQTVHYCK
jgi:hypothetical protein